MKKGEAFEIEFKLDEKIYLGFIDLFNDKNPLHINDIYAKEKGFQSKVMHGNILNGFVSYFIGERLPLKNVIILSQEIKFFKPSYLNDNLVFNAEIVDVFESFNVIEIKYIFTRKNDIKIASGKVKLGTI